MCLRPPPATQISFEMYLYAGLLQRGLSSNCVRVAFCLLACAACQINKHAGFRLQRGIGKYIWAEGLQFNGTVRVTENFEREKKTPTYSTARRHTRCVHLCSSERMIGWLRWQHGVCMNEKGQGALGERDGTCPNPLCGWRSTWHMSWHVFSY